MALTAWPKSAAGDVALNAGRAEELRVIGQIEGLGAHFQRAARPSNEERAGRGGVEVLHAGTGEEAAARVANGSQGGEGELCGVKDRPCRRADCG